MLLRAFLFAILITSLLAVPVAEGAKINAQASKLAKLMKPPRGSSKVAEGDLEKASDRLIAIIEVLEANARGSGPPPRNLIETTFSQVLTGLNPRRESESLNVFVKAWREAQHLGLFDEEGEFSRKITVGPESGKDCVFEYIAPVEAVPRLSTDPIIVRIVSPAGQRKGDTLNAWDAAFTERVRTVAEQEASDVKAVSVGRKKDKKAIDDVWKKAVAEAGESFKEVPRVILEGAKAGSPSRLSKNRWAVSIEVINQSHHATEVTLEVYLLAESGVNRELFLLAKRSEKLKLRAAEAQEKRYYSNAERGYRAKVAGLDGLNLKNKKDAAKVKVDYRGWAARVLHGDEVIARAASSAFFLPYVGENFAALGSLP